MRAASALSSETGGSIKVKLQRFAGSRSDVMSESHFVGFATIVVHQNAVCFQCLLSVLLQQEVESLSQSSLSRWTKKVILDAVEVDVTSPDDAQRFEQIPIYMSC